MSLKWQSMKCKWQDQNQAKLTQFVKKEAVGVVHAQHPHFNVDLANTFKQSKKSYKIIDKTVSYVNLLYYIYTIIKHKHKMSKKLETLGLVEVTSQRQADNGTVCYHDPITGCDYMSYASGYVRRQYKTKTWYGRTIATIYQLNKTKIAIGKWGEQTVRILEPDADVRFDIIARAAVNYRNTVKSYAK